MTLESAINFALLAYALTAGISFGVALLIKSLSIAIHLHRSPPAETTHGALPRLPKMGTHAESAASES